ncbi:MAG: ATP-binding cassette domain-containing protein, partial [Pseudomonadales bacterium]|nr:ATP-binding cassette domain-containing protein [Pseudomonadales bacterium]
MLLVYSPLLASIVLVSVLLFLISQLAFYLPMKHRTHEKISASAQLDSDFMETIRSIQAIKRFGTEAERESLWQNKFNTTINASIRLGRLSLAREVLDASVAKLSYLLVVFLGAREVLEGKLTIGMLYAFMAYRGHLASAATSLVQEYLRYLMLSVHLERLADIQTAPTDASTRAFMPLPVNGDFSLQKVAFRYAAQEPWILQDFSLELSAGSKLCILGPSGCGKSTLLGLMQGTLEPQQGQILVDGYDLSGIGLTSLRTHSAGVMQQDQLMSGSLTANISFFDPFPDDQRIVTAAKLAAIHDDIVAFPMGYESVVGDMGTILSAGQHSRVLLARALYRQPRILFLDECTAHLDRDTELKVMTELMKSDITIIFITHNPGLAEMADQILDFRAIRHPQALMA